MGTLATGLERVFGAIRPVKANGSEEETQRLYSSVSEARFQAIVAAKWKAAAQVAAGFATQLAFLAVLGVEGFRVAAGDLAISGFVAFLLYLFGLT